MPDDSDYHGTVTLSEVGVSPPGVLPTPPPGGPAPGVSFDTNAGVAFAPSTLVSPNFLCGEPQLTVEKAVARTQAGRIDPKRVYIDCPLGSRSNTSLLSRSTDGGQSFRLLLDPTCAPRNRANCNTSGGGDSEEDVNLVTGTLLFADQEVLAQEGLASSIDHGDTFPAARQFPITSTTTDTDRQWLAWVDPANATVLGQGLEGLDLASRGVGQYVIGIGPGGVPLDQPIPQIPNVGQSGQVRVDNNDSSPGRGWIYQPYGGFATGGIIVATAPAPRYQDLTAWQSTMVSADSRQLFPWVSIDDGGNAYLAWADDNGQAWLSASPIESTRATTPCRVAGRARTGRPRRRSTGLVDLKSTAFPEVIAGDAAGSRSPTGQRGLRADGAMHAPDDCWPRALGVLTDVIQDATDLANGRTTTSQIGQVNHRVVHVGSICTSGTTCGTTCTAATPCTGDRSLLDMMDLSTDPDGRVSSIFMDNNNRSAHHHRPGGKNGPFLEFSKLVTGPSLKGPGTIDVTIPTGGRRTRRGTPRGRIRRRARTCRRSTCSALRSTTRRAR